MKRRFKGCEGKWVGALILLFLSSVPAQNPQSPEAKLPVRAAEKPKVEVSPYPCASAGKALVTSSTDRIVFSSDILLRNWAGKNPVGWYVDTTFFIAVLPPVPHWGALIQLSPLRGPDGEIPPNRLRVSSPADGEKQKPLDKPRKILINNPEFLGKEIPVRLAATPAWDDPPGKYSGSLIIQPYPRDRSLPYVSRGDDEAVDYEQEISIQIEIPQLITIIVENTEVNFQVNFVPGEYSASKNVVFRVQTNASEWHIDCNATPLVHTDKTHQIPPTRLLWQSVDRFGNVLDEGNLGDNPTVLVGQGAVQDMEVILRLRLQTNSSDIAGNYKGTLSLTGLAGP